VSTEPSIKMSDSVGTIEYMAPEIICDKVYTSAVDWWAFGIILFEMLHRVSPFRGDKQKSTPQRIKECILVFPKRTPFGVKISKTAKRFIRELLVHDAINRLGYQGGATEIKSHPYFRDVKFQLLMNETPPIIPKVRKSEREIDVCNLIDDPSEIVNPEVLKDGD